MLRVVRASPCCAPPRIPTSSRQRTRPSPPPARRPPASPVRLSGNSRGPGSDSQQTSPLGTRGRSPATERDDFAGGSQVALGREALPAFLTTALQNRAPRFGAHALAKAVNLLPLPLVRLVRPFHNDSCLSPRSSRPSSAIPQRAGSIQ